MLASTLTTQHHITILLVFTSVVTAVVLLGRWLDRRGREHILRYTLVGLAGAFFIPMQVWYWLPPRLDWAWSLPLHFCDLTGALAPLTLLLQVRWMRALLYFWGIGLSTHAFITPVQTAGPDQAVFWLFWGSHSIIVGYAIYDLAVRRFRPDWYDLGLAVYASLIYGIIVFPLNAWTGWNYGYIGPTTPDVPTIIDALGPWPLRVIWMSLITAVLFVLCLLPWRVVAWWQRRRSNQV